MKYRSTLVSAPVATGLCVDTTQLFASGFSYGAAMSSRCKAGYPVVWGAFDGQVVWKFITQLGSDQPLTTPPPVTRSPTASGTRSA